VQEYHGLAVPYLGYQIVMSPIGTRPYAWPSGKAGVSGNVVPAGSACARPARARRNIETHAAKAPLDRSACPPPASRIAIDRADR